MKGQTTLSDAEREVYESCEKNGLRPSELAKYSDRDASSIRTLLRRARRKRTTGSIEE